MQMQPQRLNHVTGKNATDVDPKANHATQEHVRAREPRVTAQHPFAGDVSPLTNPLPSSGRLSGHDGWALAGADCHRTSAGLETLPAPPQTLHVSYK
jgi:hypothetical protein